MTTSTRVGKTQSKTCRGFSLVELLISLGIATLLLSAVLGGVGYIFKSQYSLANYCRMDQETRKALELVGRDIKQFSPADGVNPLSFNINSANQASETQTFSCSIPAPSNPSQNVAVTYTYSKSAGTFSRTVPFENDGAAVVLVKNITSFRISGSSRPDSTGAVTNYADINALKSAVGSVKQIQIQFTTQSGSILTKAAGVSSQQVTSAQYSIRRKI